MYSMSTAVKERPAKAVRAKRSLEKQRGKLFAKLQEINHAIHEAGTDTAKSENLTLAKLRAALGWSRNQLARVMNASDRAIVNWERGDPIRCEQRCRTGLASKYRSPRVPMAFWRFAIQRISSFKTVTSPNFGRSPARTA